jgi:isochorismate pyruvate lyase
MKQASDCNSLEDVRKEIDRIDQAIITLLGERLAYTKEVVKYRDPQKPEVPDKERYLKVIKERGKWGENNGLDSRVIEQVYTMLLNYYIEQQTIFANTIKTN